MIFYQFILFNIGISLHDCYIAVTSARQTPASKQNILSSLLPVFCSLGAVGLMLFIVESSDALLLPEYVKLLVSMFQIRMAFGLTAVVRALLKRSVTTLLMQAGFFTYMLAHNFYQNWQLVDTIFEKRLEDIQSTSIIAEDGSQSV